jgi:hypothetical protein
MADSVSRLANPARRDLRLADLRNHSRFVCSETVAPGFSGAAGGRGGASRLLSTVATTTWRRRYLRGRSRQSRGQPRVWLGLASRGLLP